MADMSLENLVASKPFRFIVGEEEREFMMHSNLVAKMSNPLNALINGSMKETRDGVAHLSDVNAETFTRFFQYTYKGDYEVAESRIELPGACENPLHKICSTCNSTSTKCSTCRKEWEYCRCYSSAGYCKKHDAYACPDCRVSIGVFKNEGLRDSKVVQLWKGFVEESQLSMRFLHALRISEDPERCWCTVFLAHAQVYVFADCYAIESLAELSKRKLHQSLILFELKADNVDQITNLVDYVCRNTLDDDQLRILLCRYCAYNIQQLSLNDGFNKLLAEMGDFSSGVIKQLLKRLS